MCYQQHVTQVYEAVFLDNFGNKCVFFGTDGKEQMQQQFLSMMKNIQKWIRLVWKENFPLTTLFSFSYHLRTTGCKTESSEKDIFFLEERKQAQSNQETF